MQSRSRVDSPSDKWTRHWHHRQLKTDHNSFIILSISLSTYFSWCNFFLHQFPYFHLHLYRVKYYYALAPSPKPAEMLILNPDQLSAHWETCCLKWPWHPWLLCLLNQASLNNHGGLLLLPLRYLVPSVQPWVVAIAPLFASGPVHGAIWLSSMWGTLHCVWEGSCMTGQCFSCRAFVWTEVYTSWSSYTFLCIIVIIIIRINFIMIICVFVHLFSSVPV